MGVGSSGTFPAFRVMAIVRTISLLKAAVPCRFAGALAAPRHAYDCRHRRVERGHAVLMIRTDRGDFILRQQARRKFTPWHETPYVYVSRERPARNVLDLPRPRFRAGTGHGQSLRTISRRNCDPRSRPHLPSPRPGSQHGGQPHPAGPVFHVRRDPKSHWGAFSPRPAIKPWFRLCA